MEGTIGAGGTGADIVFKTGAIAGFVAGIIGVEVIAGMAGVGAVGVIFGIG